MSTRKSFSFGPEHRLRTKRHFARVQSNSRKLYSRHFAILVSPAEQDRSRIGITITKKIDSRAVVRNRLRRKIREVFRLNREHFAGSFDIIVIARNNAPECSSADVKREIMGALFHGNCLKKRKEPERC